MQSVLVLVTQDTTYQEIRRDNGAGLFFNRTAIQPAPAVALALFRGSYRPPEPDVDTPGSNAQLYFQFVHAAQAASGVTPFPVLFRSVPRAPDAEPDYRRTNHQLY